MKRVVILILFLFIMGCGRVEDLGEAEIEEYEGQKLDSISDFRENSIKGPQYIDIENYSLKISGFVESLKEYSYDEVLDNKLYKKAVTLNCVEGWSARILWEGVLVRELIGDPLPEANTVIFHAYDGYSTSFPLEYLYDNDIIMAYKMNGLVMPPERGFPFQLVAESKWGYKWIKWITEIELSGDESYEGYWESRGYSKTGNLDEVFLE